MPCLVWQTWLLSLALLVSCSVQADFWLFSTRRASYDSFLEWYNLTCETEISYREGRESNGVWWFSHAVRSPCENQPTWYYTSGLYLPSGFEGACEPYDTAYREFDGQSGGRRLSMHGERTWALWDRDDGFVNRQLAADGASGFVMYNTQWYAYARGIDGIGNLLAQGPWLDFVDFNFDPDFDGWSNDLTVFNPSATGLNNGNVEVHVYLADYAEEIEFP